MSPLLILKIILLVVTIPVLIFIALFIVATTFFVGEKLIKTIVGYHEKYKADQFVASQLGEKEVINLLKKIYGFSNEGRVTHPQAYYYNFIFFTRINNVFRENKLFNVLLGSSEQPTLKKRIYKLQPEWNGTYTKVTLKHQHNYNTKENDVLFNQEYRDKLTNQLQIQTKLPYSAVLLTACIFLSKKNEQLFNIQIKQIVDEEKGVKDIKNLFEMVNSLNYRAEFSLFTKCMGTIKQLDDEQKNDFLVNIKSLLQKSNNSSFTNIIYFKIILYHLKPNLKITEEKSIKQILHLFLKTLSTSYEYYEKSCQSINMQPLIKNDLTNKEKIQLLASLTKFNQVKDSGKKRQIVKAIHSAIEKDKLKKEQFLMIQLLCYNLKISFPNSL